MKIEEAHIGEELRYIENGVSGKVVELNRKRMPSTDTIYNKIYDMITIEIRSSGSFSYTTDAADKFISTKDEKYYICKNCGEMTTQYTIDRDLECGCSGNCECMNIVKVWNPKTKKFETEFDRTYIPYTEIPKELYDELIKEKNAVLRLRMLSTV